MVVMNNDFKVVVEELFMVLRATKQLEHKHHLVATIIV